MIAYLQTHRYFVYDYDHTHLYRHSFTRSILFMLLHRFIRFPPLQHPLGIAQINQYELTHRVSRESPRADVPEASRAQHHVATMKVLCVRACVRVRVCVREMQTLSWQ